MFSLEPVPVDLSVKLSLAIASGEVEVEYFPEFGDTTYGMCVKLEDDIYVVGAVTRGDLKDSPLEDFHRLVSCE
ncbi:MAG: hypothetical protein D6698_09945 [Gammaproteobacteria bacterium]|nr:MAG: hypothetical protein D6698_09945 [Gammaproteobacteria bacterium]